MNSKPDKKVSVFLFAGQSNMEGRANGRNLSEPDLARLHNAQKRIRLAYNHFPLGPLDVAEPTPKIAEIYGIDRLFGPELFFGLAMAEAWPDERMLFIKRTRGATSLHGCWNPEWSEDKAAIMNEKEAPKLFQDFEAYAKELLSAYRPDEYEIRAMLWVQGEADTDVETAAAAYRENLTKLIDRVRRELKSPALPFFMLQVGGGKVVEGMQRVAQELPDVFLIPNSSESGSQYHYQTMENGHFNNEGIKSIGYRFADAFLGYCSRQS